MKKTLQQILETRISDVSDVYIPRDVDPEDYVREQSISIIEHKCEPFLVNAIVTPPGFPDSDPGQLISGWCVAQNAGYWLVYQPDEERFCCFWGEDVAHLGAPGIYGSPIYCWTA